MRRWFRETGPGEWGERPRERVTVMPPENRGDKSECPDRLITLLPTPGAHGPEGTVRPFASARPAKAGGCGRFSHVPLSGRPFKKGEFRRDEKARIIPADEPGHARQYAAYHGLGSG